jgi:hypothetical protein
MNKTLARPAFVTMGEPVNDQRFGHPDTFDKSTYLSTISRPRSLVPFEGFASRESTLIQKGGNSLANLKDKAEANYDLNAKLGVMKNLTKTAAKLNKVSDRKASFGNLYRQDRDLSPDHYDSVKIAKVDIKLRKKSTPLVEMNKQTKRDFSKMYQTSDFFKNIQRDNDRHDYIKKLLSYDLDADDKH